MDRMQSKVRVQSVDCEVKVKDALTVAETAERLGTCTGFVYDLIHEGRIPAVRLGARRLVVPRKALESLLDGTWQPDGGER